MKKFLLLPLFILVFSTAAFAQSDTQQTFPDLSRYEVKNPGMQFYWGGNPSKKAGDAPASGKVLYMSGKIQPGDYERFRAFMRVNLEWYKRSTRIVVLDSNGGNVAEALKIAHLLRSMHVETSVYNSQCASACFYLFVSGDRRFAEENAGLGIHRAYFDPTYFSGLSSEEAKKKHTELTEAVTQFLKANSVPQYLIERMNQASSKDIYWLNLKDKFEGLGTIQPWYQEMLIAKCGLDVPLENRLLATPKDSPQYAELRKKMDANEDSVYDCERAFISNELKNLGTILQPDLRNVAEIEARWDKLLNPFEVKSPPTSPDGQWQLLGRQAGIPTYYQRLKVEDDIISVWLKQGRDPAISQISVDCSNHKIRYIVAVEGTKLLPAETEWRTPGPKYGEWVYSEICSKFAR